MPYGTMKARTGDPYQWIHSHFEADLAKKARGQMTEAWDTTMNTPKSKKGMFKGKTLAALKAELAKLKKNPNKTEALKTKEHELTFAIRAKQKDKFGSIKESTDDEMFEGVLGRMKNLAFGNGGVPDRPNVTGRVEKCANCGHDLRKDPNSSRLTHANFKDDAACKAASRHNNPEGLSHEVMGEDCYGSASPTPSCEPDVDTLSFNTNYDSTTNKTSVNVNASGAKAAELLRMLKLAGMAPEVELTEDASKTPKTTKEEESEPWANEPNEQTLSIDAQVNMGNDLHGPHKQFKKEYPGDNPMTIANNAIKATESKLRAKFNALTEGK